MTYNWNTMVEITVPTGTNGWLYSGEVIINGVKVRFPVGVPTSVPEPAAVLLKKMIELEQEEDANTAKPQNHYVGDVTIPAGKTLTLEEGAMVNDMAGGLGGGSASAGGGVQIIPGTVALEDVDGSNKPFVTSPMTGAEIEKLTTNGAYCVLHVDWTDAGAQYMMPLSAITPDGCVFVISLGLTASMVVNLALDSNKGQIMTFTAE